MELIKSIFLFTDQLVRNHPYLPLGIFFLLSILFAVGTLLISFLLRPHRPDVEKNSPYECGVPPVGDTRERQMVRFYIIAMLFILFDVEAVFLYPWALVFDMIGLFALVEMGLFIIILLLGYLYVWRRGALRWV